MGRCSNIATPADGRRLAWHTLSAGRILDSEGVEGRGLRSAEAAARARRFGINELAADCNGPICAAVALSVVAADEIRKAGCGVPLRTPASPPAPTSWSPCP